MDTTTARTPIQIDFEATTTAHSEAFSAHAPDLRALLDQAPDEQTRDRIRDLATITATLQDSPYRRCLGVFAAQVDQVAEWCEQRDDTGPALLAAIRQMRADARHLARTSWRAQVDADHVNRALRILAVRNPAAHDAAAAALAPSPVNA